MDLKNAWRALRGLETEPHQRRVADLLADFLRATEEAKRKASQDLQRVTLEAREVSHSVVNKPAMERRLMDANKLCGLWEEGKMPSMTGACGVSINESPIASAMRAELMTVLGRVEEY